MRDEERLKIIYYYVSFSLPANVTHGTITTTIHTQIDTLSIMQQQQQQQTWMTMTTTTTTTHYHELLDSLQQQQEQQ